MIRRSAGQHIMQAIPLFLLLLSTALQAQFKDNYHPIPVLDTIPSAYQASVKKRLASDKILLKTPHKAVNTSVQELLSNRTDYIIQTFNDDYFIADGEMVSYLRNILKTIYQQNPQLPAETNVLVYRSNAVNAVSFGEGTIALTLGLLARLETEGQIMFVLCHELAHYHAKHSDNKIVDVATLVNDKDYKKQVKSITKSEYGQFTRFSELAKNLELSITRHGRDKEFEADSLALLYYRKASTDLRSPIRTLEILDSADLPLYKQALDLKKMLSTDAYAFKDQWLAYTPSTTWHQSADENDTTRTHPSCARRIAALKRQMGQNVSTSGDTKPNAFQLISQFEMVASGYHFKHYGRTLFESLALSTQYPDNVYLHAMIGRCLYQQYVAQKNHELGLVLSLPDPRFPENYDRYLTFMHTLRLGEMAALSYYYTAKRMTTYSRDEEFLFSYWLVTHTGIGNDTPDQIKKDYTQKFPSGKYINQLK